MGTLGSPHGVAISGWVPAFAGMTAGGLGGKVLSTEHTNIQKLDVTPALSRGPS
jgi:hypothetical protein